MNQSDLTFYSSQDLVEELLRRQSFLGVVVHAVEETRGRGWVGDKSFQVRFNQNLDTEAAGRLLSTVGAGICSPES